MSFDYNVIVSNGRKDIEKLNSSTSNDKSDIEIMTKPFGKTFSKKSTGNVHSYIQCK